MEPSATAGPAPGSSRGLKRFLVKRVGFPLLQGFERVVAGASLVGDRPFFDPGRFAWTSPLEAGWKAIRAELEAVLAGPPLPNFQDISVDQRVLTTDDRWKTFFLYGYGYRSDRNCARCPATARLVEAVPGMKTAFFSILHPGKRVRPHRGPYKGLLRYHLGLIVPSGPERCGIKVGGETAGWREGGSLVFDDTYEHEVWNETERLRAILFLDVVRPLRPPVAQLNRALLRLIGLTPLVQDGVRNQRRWEEATASAPPPGA